MQTPQLPYNENERIKTLQALHVLDTEAEYRFDRITQLISNIFQVPIALVSLIDTNRQWFKSCVGLDARETSRDISFCGHAILNDEVFVIENALDDPRFADNPLVTGDPNIRFYAGCPLKHANGSNLGTLCLIDREARVFGQQDRKALAEFAALVELELVQLTSQSLDPETGVNNQQGFYELGNNSLQVCNRLNLSVSLAFLYIKGLMSLQKELSEQDYLDCVTMIAETFKVTFKSSDVVARYDQCSFVALLSNHNIDSTKALLRDIETLVNNKLSSRYPAGGYQLVTGVSERYGEQDLQELIFNAFENLHK